MYAILLNGNLVDKYPTFEDAEKCYNYIVSKNRNVKIVDCSHASHIVVTYTELGGSWGYGHQEIAFETYGGIITCLYNLMNWAKEAQRIFGPDWRDVRDYFKNCSITINSKDRNNWFYKYFVETIKRDMIFI